MNTKLVEYEINSERITQNTKTRINLAKLLVLKEIEPRNAYSIAHSATQWASKVVKVGQVNKHKQYVLNICFFRVTQILYKFGF